MHLDGEYLEWPPGQTFKCYSEFVPMETFLKRFINDNTRTRIYEPENGYNAQDPGINIGSWRLGGSNSGGD